MAVTPSTYVELSSAAPSFTLPDTVSGNEVALEDVRGAQGTVVMFICNHCPFVLHVNDELVRLAKDYSARGIGFVAISSNDAVAYPQDGPARMKAHAAQLGYPFPYLYDESQAVARAYDAACTPDLYLFDGDLKLVYHGQLDDSRPGNRKPVTGHDMRAALEATLTGTPYTDPQKPSMGCNIKWK